MQAFVKKIIILNAKGGSGKTTIATNLVSQFARAKFKSVLMDYDAQGSSLRWLQLRPKDKTKITSVNAYKDPYATETRAWALRLPPDTQRVVIDTPAGVQGLDLVGFVNQVDTILLPVQPSPIDIHAATRFIEQLLLIGKVRQKGVRVGVIANKVKSNTLAYQSLQRFLKALNLPIVGTLRDTQNYVHAAEKGVGVHELGTRRAEVDSREWMSIIHWLEDGWAKENTRIHDIMKPVMHDVHVTSMLD